MDHARSKYFNRKSSLNGKVVDRIKLPNETKHSKENLRISELLLRAKIDSSFRIKGPKISKNSYKNVENPNQLKEQCDGICSGACRNVSAGENNVAVDGPNNENSAQIESANEADMFADTSASISDNGLEDTTHTEYDYKEISQDKQLQEDKFHNEQVENNENGANVLNNVSKNRATLQKMASFTESHTESYINRKLSFDYNMARRRESLSKSEMDLNQVGKIPLQRKTSFFRRNFNSFVKNTSEVFRKQSERMGGERKPTISYSLQSLDDKNALADASRISQDPKKHFNGSLSSLDRNSGNSSLCSLNEDQPTSNFSETSSIKSLNELYVNEAMMAGRAFSVSSGLDTVRSQRPSAGKAHRSNRYTWLASDSVAEYMRRRVEEEMARRQEGGATNLTEGSSEGAARVDPYKGRRLSYERAVSRPAGEELALPTRVTDNLRRRFKIIDSSDERPSSLINADLATRLYDFSTKGVPALKGYELPNISDQAYNYIYWVDANSLNKAFVLDGELTPEEEARQEVIKELVATEADYIRHLVAVVQVFIAAAHDLQENGRMLSIETVKLFSNLPDVLNANLCFWDSSLYPMLIDSLQNRSKFNVEYLHLGFSRFHDLFQPYERYLSDQSKMQDYLRSLDNDIDFHTYITWCESHRHCNRLKLADILVKPMQRLTKYSLMLRRIINHTDNEQEKLLLYTMDNSAKSYVQNLNRTIKKRQDTEHLESLIDSLDIYELECKDDEMDRMFRLHSNLNLKYPMSGCLPYQCRSVIYEGDLRFKDNKEQKIDTRVVLLTDMLLICKKIGSKISGYYFKIIRPKYMVDKLVHNLQFKTGKTGRELHSIIFVALDETLSAYNCFSITDAVKETCSQTLRNWDLKFREAKLTMELNKIMVNHPTRDPHEINVDTVADHSWRQGECLPNDLTNIEREAKERVAMMLHKPISTQTTELHSQSSIGTDSSEVTESLGSMSKSSSAHQAYGRSTWSGRSSRVPSLQHSCSSNDGASSDGINLGASTSGQTFKLPTAVEVHLPPYNEVASITVQISNDETEHTAPEFLENARAQCSPNSNIFRRNTLNVHPQCGVMALVHSLPDLTLEPRPIVANYPPNYASMTVSERIYFLHQEKLNRYKPTANRNISSQGNYTLLSADNRGTSYPPPTSQRASLKRGVAFSHPMKNPPLSKMGHVNSQSTVTHLDPNPGHSGYQRSVDHSDHMYTGYYNDMDAIDEALEQINRSSTAPGRWRGAPSIQYLFMEDRTDLENHHPRIPLTGGQKWTHDIRAQPIHESKQDKHSQETPHSKRKRQEE